jgi:hypothetical protein
VARGDFSSEIRLRRPEIAILTRELASLDPKSGFLVEKPRAERDFAKVGDRRRDAARRDPHQNCFTGHAATNAFDARQK